MALTRLGLCGPSSAYPGFTAKTPEARVPPPRFEFDLIITRVFAFDEER